MASLPNRIIFGSIETLLGEGASLKTETIGPTTLRIKTGWSNHPYLSIATPSERREIDIPTSIRAAHNSFLSIVDHYLQKEGQYLAQVTSVKQGTFFTSPELQGVLYKDKDSSQTPEKTT